MFSSMSDVVEGDNDEISIEMSLNSVDNRILWIRNKVMKFLGLHDDYTHLFNSLLKENDNYYEDKLMDFLSDDLYCQTDLKKKLIFFYKTYQDTVAQEEVSVWEETTAHIAQITAAMASLSMTKGRPQRLTKSAPGKVEKGENEKKKKGKKLKKDKKADESTSEDHSTVITDALSTPLSTAVQHQDEFDGEDDDSLSKTINLQKSKGQTKSTGSLETSTFVPPSGQEDKYILTKKMVDKVVKVPVIHILCGEIDPNDPNLTDINFFYFLRTSDEGIPHFDSWEICNDRMTDYLLVGSLHSNFIDTLNNLLIHVFQPLVERQYQCERSVQKPSGITQSSSSAEKAQSVLSQSVMFSRASNFLKVMATLETVEGSSEVRQSINKTPEKPVDLSNIQEFSMETSKKELLEHLEQLTTIVQWTLEHARGDIVLPMPKTTDIQALDPSDVDENIVAELEDSVMAWEQHVEKILQAQLNEIPQDCGLLAEHEYWHDREINLSMLVEQLNTPNIKKTLAILNNRDSAVASAFHWTEIDLWKHYTQARDNNKFISIVLRYFKLIVESSDFKAISNAIPDLMGKLKMIWILSKYYSTEENMTMLLERVSWQLCENIRKNLSVKQIFKKPLKEGLEKTEDACAMMKGWKIAYLKTRESIELSEKGARWELDQPRLFRETEYIAKVCDDIHKIISVLEDFSNIFGTELKSIINDPAQIDDIVKRVDELVVPIQNADFNIFTEVNKENWDATINWFYLQVSCLENEAKFFIDQCFAVLINAEQALDVLLKFKTIKTREEIQRQLQMKFDVIMQQFSKEISEVEGVFNTGKKRPPLLRYFSPIAGAIFWERQLLNRLQGPILRLQKAEKNIDPRLKILAFTQYSDVAKHMKEYENTKFLSWVNKADSQVITAMKKNILRLISIKLNQNCVDKFSLKKVVEGLELSKKNSRRQKSIFTGQTSTLNAQRSQTSSLGLSNISEKSVTEVLESKIMTEVHLAFEVDFDWHIFDIIHEAEMLEQMGFELPASVRDLGMQKDRVRADIEVTQAVINQYNEIMQQLDRGDMKLLKKIIQGVEKHILSGVTRFNWYSLAISDYAATCKKSLKNLASLVTQVRQLKRDLDHRIENICSYNLFTTSEDSAGSEHQLTACKWYFSDIESKRTELVGLMLKSYQSISPMLIKLESLVEGTSTGKSLAMEYFYEHYEKQIFTGLVSCFTQSLDILNALLCGKKPIFLIDTVLLASEVILRPSASDINTIILHNVNDLFDRCRQFSRWMSGTCHECKPIKNGDQGDFVTFSFYEDIVGVQAINDRVVAVHETTQKLALECLRYLFRWKRYANLWRSDKQEICEKFAATNLTLHEFDEKFTFYDRIIEEINETTPHYDVSSIRINLEPFFTSIREHAQEWKQILGNYLISDTQKSMNDLKLMMKNFRTEIELVINDLERLKIVMQAVTSIKKMAIQVEMQYNEYQETFRILKIHDIKYAKEDEEKAFKIQQEWESLYLGALFRTTTLESTTENLREKTLGEISQFLTECQALSENFYAHGPGSVGQDLDIGLKKMKDFGAIIKNFDDKRLDLLTVELLFDLPPGDYSIFLTVKEDFDNMQKIYSLYEAQKSARDVWSKTLWVDLDPQQLIDGIDSFLKQFHHLPDPIKQLNIGQTLVATMNTFKNSVPLFIELKNEAMRERHWKELMEKTGKHFDMVENRFTLHNMFEMDLEKFQGIAQEIVTNAVRELTIERGIEEISEIWDKTTFPVIKHYNGAEDRGFILGSLEEVIQVLEDHTMNLQSMSASQYVAPFLPTVKKWEHSLQTISEIIEVWIELQKKWLYLEGIFLGSSINTQLPEIAKKFDDIDHIYRRNMLDTSKRLNVYECCMIPGRKQAFMGLIHSLDKCQKSLVEYLNGKRMIFSRFNFLSDEELLGILGSHVPTAIQDYINKIFNNLNKFWLKNEPENGETTAIGLISSEGEIMEFKNAVLVHGNVEEWMVIALKEMQESNRHLTKKAVYNYGKIKKSRTDWIQDFQGMMIIVANQIWWTAEVENVFIKINSGFKNSMKEYLEFLNHQLDEIVKFMSGTVTNNDRKKLETVLTIDVHARDIVEEFDRDCVMNSTDFEWESQLRFYWDHDGDTVCVNQCTCSFDYGYEYVGLSERLVITPLTDRIYLTITQALSIHLGGAPMGPAGTGKTETVKDLAKALGRLCIVTNCGDAMDNVTIGKTLGGLAQSGAWGCFDEFNRIEIGALSVISTQLQTIRSALQSKAQKFIFEAQDIVLDPKIGIFITMNPGYAGRTELPESVKSLFRPVVCNAPDNELICQIKLFSAGFLTAKTLAKKMTVLYDLAKEHLSKQTHYDFGLRALKSVLNIAGDLKKTTDDLTEDLVLMRALRDMNLPKLIFDDVPLFLELIKDLFPGLECPKIRDLAFNKAVEDTLHDDDYVIVTEQVDKCVQLREVMMSRHSTMIIGPTAGGKTVIIQTVCRAQARLNLPTKLHVLNPKACTVAELYGVLDPLTREWTDGLFSNIFRTINRPLEGSTNERRYILFDGDVDPLWIENMNSVMDDNRFLTLANQERIMLQSYCSLLFEVGDLLYASPATVSRAGMVYVDPKTLGYQPYIDRWTRNQPDAKYFQKMCDKYVPGAVELIIYGLSGLPPLKMIIQQTSLSMIQQLYHVIDGFYKVSQAESVEIDEKSQLIEAMYIQACYCSLGAALTAESRPQFDDYMRRTCGLIPQDVDELMPIKIGHIPALDRSLYDYVFDLEEKMWKPWKSLVPEYVHNRGKNFSDILVPTVDTIRANWFIKLMNSLQKPVLLVGETGTSKTAIIHDFIQSLDDKFSRFLTNFSSRTTSLDLQRNLESVMEKRTSNIYGPVIGKTLVVFVDDLNMPLVDKYGTQQPIAFLRLLVERGGFYDRDKDLNWKQVKDICYLAAMGKPGGGRNPVDPRFLSLFSVYNVIFPCQDTLEYIYRCILTGHLDIFEPEVRIIAGKLVEMMLRVYAVVKMQLPPTPEKFHYVFNMRDLSRITAGLLQSHKDYFSTAQLFVRLWRNEVTRVMCDRLVSEDDQALVGGCIELEIKKAFADTPEIVEHSLRDPLLFGDFRNAYSKDMERFYEDVLDYEAAYSLFLELLEQHNEKKSKISMVLFNDALDHLTRIHRALRMHRGNVLVVGIGGCGKQSAIKLAAFTAHFEVFEIALNRGYNERSFREDLKKLFMYVGVEKKRMVFLFTAAQVVDESFLEMVNNMLTSGIVPAIFDDEEIDGIISSCLPFAVEDGFGPTKENVWAYFLESCTKNLRIALAMSPSGDALRSYCRSYPGIVNNSVIDWMFPWPRDALYAVAKMFLQSDRHIPEEYRNTIVDHVVHVHNSTIIYIREFYTKFRRKIYITPNHFIDCIKTFLHLISTKKTKITVQQTRLSNSLQKIAEASITLTHLNDDLAIQKAKVAEQTKNCHDLLASIEQKTTIATENQNRSLTKRAEISIRNEEIGKESAEAKATLAEAQPGITAAKQALNDLEKNDITEIRSFAAPAEPVQIVGECIAIIRGAKEISWKTAKGLMSDPSFLRTLQDLNIEEITIKQQQMIKSNLKKSDKFDQMPTISKAGYGLYKFVLAVLDYCTVYRQVKPKIDRVVTLEKEAKRAQIALEREEEELKILDKQLEELNVKYEAAMADRMRIQEDTDLLERRLNAAEKLITGLSMEKSRWTIELEGLQDELKFAIGNGLLSAAFLSYTGPFSHEFRTEMMYNNWQKSVMDRNIPISQPWRVEKQLCDDVEISKWNSDGLPPDEFSLQNAILATRGSRFPLCIDPQNQAFDWIRRKEDKNNVKIVSFDDFDYLKQLEMAIKYGFPIVFHDVDHIDPIVDNVLSKNIKSVNNRSFVMLGDKEVDWDPEFRVYLTTKLSNPMFNPSVYSKVHVINNMVTINGLESQLLSIVVSNEEPSIEEQRENLVFEISENKQLLQELEDSLLREIATNQDNMLDNLELIETLDNTKISAFDVANKIRLAEVTSENINQLRNNYQSVAKRGALLFFVLSNMSMLNSMYQYSLTGYCEIFSKSVKNSAPDLSLRIRLINIIESLTKNVYDHGCTGIFERHKLIFSLGIAVKIEENAGKVNEEEFDFFIRGNVSVGDSKSPNSLQWLAQSGWKDVEKLSADFPVFSGLSSDLLEHSEEWHNWCESDRPESEEIPCGYERKIRLFQKLMLIRCLRIDRVYCSVVDYVRKIVGDEFVTPPSVSMDMIFRQITPMMPVVLILSAGSDPTADLMDLAEQRGFGAGRFKYFSLGQGQSQAAVELLETAVARGQWLMIQNCHLHPEFLKILEKELENIDEPHPDFRLWLTTEPTDNFPIGVLQRSLKVIIEPPSGLKRNLRHTYFKMHAETLENCQHPVYRQLVYVLAFFHAVILERRKYGKIGWNINYDFNESDFSVSVAILETYLNKSLIMGDEKIPWNSLKYLICEVMYGGRIFDSFDRRISKIYIDEYFGDFLFDNFQPFYFYCRDGVKYSLPPDGLKDDYLRYIDELPFENTPEIFGLHFNAEIGYFTQTARDIWQNIIEMQPRISVNGTSTTRVDSIAGEILSKLPAEYNIEKVKKTFGLVVTPSTVVLFQELNRVNHLIKRMKTTLIHLRKAIAGEIGIDSILESIAHSLYNGTLPNEWALMAPASKNNLSSWLKHFHRRIEQYNDWVGSNEPVVMWLSGLHIPQTYLAALIQMTCRKNNWLLEKAVISTVVTKYINADEVEERPKQGCYIQGLYLEGARWSVEENRLMKCHPKVMIEELPILSVVPVKSHCLKLQDTVKIPVYVTSDRRNAMGEGLVFEADLNTQEHVSLWVLQGLSLLMNVD